MPSSFSFVSLCTKKEGGFDAKDVEIDLVNQGTDRKLSSRIRVTASDLDSKVMEPYSIEIDFFLEVSSSQE